MIVYNLEQGSDEWHRMRAGIPTASNFSKLVTSTGEPSKSMPAYAMELANDYFACKPVNRWEGNQFTERGHEFEDAARSLYELLYTSEDVTQVGFCMDDLEFYGCSPDGLVGDDGLLEIKCLPRNHTPAILYVHEKKKCPPEFYAQVQGQLLVTGREWCDLYFWHEHLPDKRLRVERDPDFQEKLVKQIVECIKERDRIYAILGEM